VIRAQAGLVRRAVRVSPNLFTWVAAPIIGLWAGMLLAKGDAQSVLLLGLLGGAALFVIVTQLEFHALLLWLVVEPIAYPFLQFPRGHPIFTFDRLWIISMLGIVLVRTRYAQTSREARVFLAVLLWLISSFLIRVVFTTGLDLYAFRLWTDAFLLPTVLFVVTRRLMAGAESWTRAAGAFTVTGAILACIGIAEKVLGFQLSSFYGTTPIGITGPADVASGLFRITGPYPYSEMYGLALTICLAATLYWVRVQPRKLMGSAVVALELVAIYFTFFRVVWIAALVICLMSFEVSPRRLQRLYVVVVAVCALAIAASGPLRTSEFHSRATNTSNVNGRLATYRLSLDIFESAPLVGVGFSRFAAAEAEVGDVSVGGVQSLGYPHSSYFWLLAEQGLVGVLPLIVLTFAGWRLVRRLGRLARIREDLLLARVAGGAASVYVLMSLTLTMLAEAPPNAFLLVVLGAVAARVDVLSRDPEGSAPER
jgi:hypothetical protein